MSIFRNFVINFKSQDDCENYLVRSKDFYPSLKGMGMQNMTVCRLTADSLIMFAVFNKDKDALATIEKTTQWRKINRFEFLDIIVLDGKIVTHYDFTELDKKDQPDLQSNLILLYLLTGQVGNEIKSFSLPDLVN